MTDLREELAGLETAEAFLDRFAIPYDQRVVDVNRLHILQRFHNYLRAATLPEEEEEQRLAYAHLLERAYRDFVGSTAQEQKALRVFQKASGTAFVDASAIGRS